MKKIIFISFVFALSYAAAFAQANYNDYQDVVYLKNGSIIHGIITEQIPEKLLKIETSDGNTFVFPIGDVEKIAKEKVEETATVIEESNLPPVNTDWQKRRYVAINAGLLMGGGSMLGADIEFMSERHWGFQAGFGFTGRKSFGVGVNYHLKNRINSSFLSLVYWHQGFGDNHWAAYVGPVYTLRLRQFLQLGIGYGIAVSKGYAIRGTDYYDDMGSLLFNVGFYFPL